MILPLLHNLCQMLIISLYDHLDEMTKTLYTVMLKVMKAQWMTTQLWNYISNDSPGDHKQNSKCITVEV